MERIPKHTFLRQQHESVSFGLADEVLVGRCFIVLIKNEEMQTPRSIHVHNLVLRLSSFNLCGSPSDVADKRVLPWNQEFKICLVDINV